MKDCINNIAKFHHLWTLYSPVPAGLIKKAGATSKIGEHQETVDKEMQRLKYYTRQLQSDKNKKTA